MSDTNELVKPLEWVEVTAARSNEDPTREPTGDYEAVSPIGVYYVEQYFGSDSYGWRVTLHGSDDVADMDDPEDAKAAAQADYERRVLSALAHPPAHAGAATEAMVDVVRKEFQKHGWGYREDDIRAALTAALGAQTPPEGAVKLDWPALVQLGRALGFFASVIKSGEPWTDSCQKEYDKANAAMKELWGELNRPTPPVNQSEGADRG